MATILSRPQCVKLLIIFKLISDEKQNPIPERQDNNNKQTQLVHQVTLPNMFRYVNAWEMGINQRVAVGILWCFDLVRLNECHSNLFTGLVRVRACLLSHTNRAILHTFCSRAHSIRGDDFIFSFESCPFYTWVRPKVYKRIWARYMIHRRAYMDRAAHIPFIAQFVKSVWFQRLGANLQNSREAFHLVLCFNDEI